MQRIFQNCIRVLYFSGENIQRISVCITSPQIKSSTYEYQHWIVSWLHQYWHNIEQTMKQYILVTALMVLQVIGMHWVPVRTLLLILRVIGCVLVLVLLHVLGFVLVLVILVLVLPQVIGWVEQQAGYVEREQLGMAPERFSLIASLELKESKSKVLQQK